MIAFETPRLSLHRNPATGVHIAYRVLVDTGVVSQPGQIPYVMGPASSETTELTAKGKYIAEFVETAMERGKDLRYTR